ncbi:hypothetical protein SLEP1_g39549 [Rubroshorea leprosula]|uniref:Reverse transcriptase domain-containing protein n=1 Tax=Rubroshorea leprosula TaxID=152421 RepID=A0AAV5L0T8_9ROSI|nr:hypothetical protein SLEP1_g39549 [Rubroshorea leprosula]
MQLHLAPSVPSNLPPHLPPPILNMFLPVDHAEGGDENQPHNSAHNSTSIANQDVVAAQLAAMQQQFGVFQLVLAHLLAQNNPDSLEKLVAEQRGAPPHRATDSIPHPLNTNITLEPYPAGFKIPQLETYDGTKDPDDHLHSFYSCMQAQNASDALMCKIFPSPLRCNARTWYYSLPLRSISSYIEMTSAFATKFSNRRLIRKTTSKLMRVKQRDGKSLKNYMSIFNDAVLEVSFFDQAVGIAAVISGLNHEKFRDNLIKHPTTTFSEVNDRSRSYNRAMQQSEGPQPQGTRNPPNRQGVGHQQAPPPLPPLAKIIHMITGGLEAGGMSSKQRKLYVREVKHQNRAQKRKIDDAEWKDQPITFTPADFEGVHVLVDTGSAPDIMYYHCFESLGLDPTLLQRYDGPLYGFNNQLVPVEGILTMNVAFGSGRTYVAPSVRFLVVKMPSSFNVVIGRPTLTKIRAMKDKDQLAKNPPQEIHDNRQVMGVEILDNRPEDETRAALGEDVEKVQIDDRDPNRKTQIGTRLSPEEKAELITFLRDNKDVFAWTSANMPRTPTLVIKEEVEKLLQVGFIKRVDYCEWVANPVLVKKINGKWWMCIYYTNLDQACPKDCYPMPNINKLVEAAFGNERLSLLDAYSDYHQVLMALEDEEKTSFYAGDEIYCYVMMPFGGATYQKMVTIVFQAQIGRNLEVYVDDIMVKSLKAEDHLTNLEETFNNFRKNRMRLNLAKCIFGVEFGKFLGFMVSIRGIEVNPEKIKAVVEMEPPKSVKDVQRLTGRVAALHRFISKSVDKCLPFFKIMRLVAQKDESGKQKKFEWNLECQAAFDELKSYLSSPHLLTKANDGEILYLYLGISDEVISFVLVREEGKQ